MNMKAFAIALSLIASTANANYICKGQVNFLGISKDNFIWANNGFGTHNLCDIRNDYCKSWFTMLTTAKVSGKSVAIYYTNASANDNCKNIGDWVTPADPVYFIEIQ